MKSQQFFYTCAGLCLLAIAYAAGAHAGDARAATTTGYILGFGFGNGYPYALRSDGTIWYKRDGPWEQAGPPFGPVPFPLEGTMLGSGFTVMTQDGHLWTAHAVDTCGIGACWTQDADFIPPPPAVAALSKTWSATKNAYRR